MQLSTESSKTHIYDDERAFWVKSSIRNDELTHLIRQGVFYIHEEPIPDQLFQEDEEILFALHIHPQLAFQIDLIVLLRAFWHQHPELQIKDQELALTAILEGWSNALFWGTLELPSSAIHPTHSDFELLLRQRLRNPLFAKRCVTLTIAKYNNKVRVCICDQGYEKKFSFEDMNLRHREAYRGLSVISNCSDCAIFDPEHKRLSLDFQLVS